jgi:hypothetical protein
MADYPISNVPRRVQYVNSGVGPYAFTFEILVQTDIAVYRGNTLLTLTTDYSVTINANGTGSITLVTAGTGNITIVGARAIQRSSDYTTGGDLFASTLNTDLDSQTIYSQQLAETLDRTIKVPVTDASTINMELPSSTTRANKVFAFNANGAPQVSVNTLAAVDAAVSTINSIAGAPAGSSAGISHIAAGSGAVTTTVQAKLRESVSVKDFGAVGDGVTDDTTAIEQAISTADSVFFPVGIYRITHTIEIGTQKALIGEYPQSRWVQGGKSTIYGTLADIGDGVPLFEAAATGSTQALTFQNLTFQSDKAVDPNDLSLLTNAGVVGVNIRGIKQGTQFLNCAFHNLKSGVRDDIGSGNYEDKVTFDQCHFNGLYLATKITPTAGCSFTNCYFDECYDWIDNTGEVTLTATRFNNSSFSQELCQIKAARIIADGIYIEGGNNWFAPTQYVSVRGSYFSEAFSAGGATKFSVQPQNDDVYVNIEGTRIATNTRVINATNITGFKKLYVRFVGLSNGANFGNASNIETALEGGMVFEGWGNTQSAWNVKTTGVGTLNGELRTNGDGLTKRVGNLARGVYWESSLNFSLSCPEQLEDYSINMSYIRLVNVGTNNGVGGNVAYYVEIRIFKGFSTTWDYDITGPDSASYAVALSNQTSTAVDVALTESHGGEGEVLFMDSANSNMQITF